MPSELLGGTVMRLGHRSTHVVLASAIATLAITSLTSAQERAGVVTTLEGVIDVTRLAGGRAAGPATTLNALQQVTITGANPVPTPQPIPSDAAKRMGAEFRSAPPRGAQNATTAAVSQGEMERAAKDLGIARRPATTLALADGSSGKGKAAQSDQSGDSDKGKGTSSAGSSTTAAGGGAASASRLSGNARISSSAAGRNIAKPSALMAVATTSGGRRCEATRLHTTKTASPTTAPKTSRLPRSGHGPRAPSPPAVLSARIPATARATPSVRGRLQRSPSATTASAAATAGVVLVTMPPSAALVNLRPSSRSTLNAKMPANDCSASTATSRRARRGSGRSRSRTRTPRIAAATAKRRPDSKNTGSRATATLPTTIELPTIAMAAVSSRQARSGSAIARGRAARRP